MSKGQFWNFVKLQMLGGKTFPCGDVCFLTQMVVPKVGWTPAENKCLPLQIKTVIETLKLYC